MLRIYKIFWGLPSIAAGLKIIIQRKSEYKPIWFLENFHPTRREIIIIGIFILVYGLYSLFSYFRSNTHIVYKFVTPGLLVLTIFMWGLFISTPLLINYVFTLPFLINFLIKIIISLLTALVTIYFHIQLKYVQNEKKHLKKRTSRIKVIILDFLRNKSI